MELHINTILDKTFHINQEFNNRNFVLILYQVRPVKPNLFFIESFFLTLSRRMGQKTLLVSVKSPVVKGLNTISFTLSPRMGPFNILLCLAPILLVSVKTRVSTPVSPTDTEDTRYFQLRYINNTCQTLLSNFKFSRKDPIPSNLKSCVVYNFTCAACNI